MSDVQLNPEWFPEHDIPPRGRSGFVRVDGRQVHYLEWGRAPAAPVLCLHGGGQTAYMYEELGATLADRYHVLAPDLPNHGDSGPITDMDRHTLASTVPAVLDEFGLERVHLVGASLLGGIVSVTFAATHPERAASISLIDIGHQLEDEGVAKIINFMKEHESFASLEEAAAAVAGYLPERKKVDPTRLTRNLRQRPDGRWEWKHAYGKRLRAAEAEGRQIPTEGSWRNLLEGMDDDARSLRCPVLVLRGGKSDVLSDEGAEAITELIPDSRLAVVKDAGHLAAGDNPESTVGLIAGFLDALSGSASK